MVEACALNEKSCVPCKGGVAPLSPAQVGDFLQEISGWNLTPAKNAIERRFTFKNFKQALAFVNQVGDIAEQEKHHPDIALGWGYVHCTLQTHAIDNLHENDFIVASKINGITMGN